MKRNSRGRLSSLQVCTLVLAGVWAVASVPAVQAQIDAQPRLGTDPATTDDRPLTPAERTERARQTDRVRAADAAPPARVRYHEEYHRPGELYVGGFGG